jgi:DNA repair protein RadC
MNTALEIVETKEAVLKPFPILDSVRNQLRTHGARSLTDEELLVLLVRHGDAKHNVLDVAHKLLHHGSGGLLGISQYTPWEIAALPGMNFNKAAAITAAIELGRRRAGLDPKDRPCVTASSTAYELLKPVLAELPHEEFWLLLLDRGNRLIARERISIGGMHGTVADPKLIYRMALERRASSIILAHNHPSGQLRPSEEDIRLTRKLVEAGKFLDIVVQDHLVVTDTGYFSFADNGQLG